MAGALVLNVPPASDDDLKRVPPDILAARNAAREMLAKGIAAANGEAPPASDDGATPPAPAVTDAGPALIDVPSAEDAERLAANPDTTIPQKVETPANDAPPPSWAAKFEALEAQVTQLSAEVPVLRQALHDKDTENNRLQAELEKARNAPVLSGDALTPEQLTKLGIAPETQDAGLDLFQAMHAIGMACARHVAREELATAVQTGQVVDGYAEYLKKRAAELPDFDRLNAYGDTTKADRDWLKYLGTRDPLSGELRGDLAQRANDRCYLGALQVLVDGFYAAYPDKKPNGDAAKANGAANGNGATKTTVAVVPLAAQRKPDTAASKTVNEQKPVYTQDEWQRAKVEAAEGRINGSTTDPRTGKPWTRAQLEAVQRQMNDAATEGRVKFRK